MLMEVKYLHQIDTSLKSVLRYNAYIVKQI